MDPADVVCAIWTGMQDRRWDDVRRLLADDLEIDWPQTREKIFGGDAFLELNRTYPGEWSIRVEEVFAQGGRVAARVTITIVPAIWHMSGFYTVRNGKLSAGIEFFAEPAEPPYERAHLTKRY